VTRRAFGISFGRPIAAALLAAAALAASCRSSRTDADRLVVADFNSVAIGLVFIAEQKGFFAEEGVKVDFLHFDLGRDALDAMLDHRADVSMAYLTPVVVRSFETSDFRILTSLHHARESTAIVARADRGIRSAADLRGKRVGAPRNTNAELFLETALALSAIPAREVDIVDLYPEDLPGALESGRVDAVALNSPYRERARRSLGDRAVEISSNVRTEMTVLLARQGELGPRHRALVKVLRALVRAERLAEERPDEALDVLRRRFPEEPAEDLGVEWRQINPHLGVHNVLLTELAHEAEFIQSRRGRARPPPEFRDLVAPEPLLEVAPDAVTIAPLAEKARSAP
jgi:NitT/TauT family transport system substrate-binding protein